jgi:hypothetical protein
MTGLATGVTFADPPIDLCANGTKHPPITLTVPAGTRQGNYPLTIDAFWRQRQWRYGNQPIRLPLFAGGQRREQLFDFHFGAANDGARRDRAVHCSCERQRGVGQRDADGVGRAPGATVLLIGASSASVAVGGTATMTVGTSSNTGLGSYSVSITGMLGTLPTYATALTNVAQAAPAWLQPIPVLTQRIYIRALCMIP